MKLRQLEYVHHIVVNKTMRDAAKELYVTEPTISQQVRELEKQVGISLFEREGRGIKLTEQGEQIYPYILDVLQSVERLKQQSILINNPDQGEIAFGLGPIKADLELQSLLASFNQELPNVKINIHESGSMDLLSAIIKGELDIALINTSIETRMYMKENKIICKPLYDSNFMLMTSSHHPLSTKPKVSYKDLYNEPLMLYRNGLIQSTIVELLGSEEKTNIVYSFVDYDSIVNLMRNGLGISIIPKSYADKLTTEQRKDIAFLEFSDFGSEMKVSLLYRHDRNQPVYIKKIIDLLSES